MKEYHPTFVGLSHIGQVFSLSWLNKIGKCNVFDFNNNNLINFKNKKFTNEENYLKKIKFDKKKLKILNNIEELSNSKIIFFTYDTPISKYAKPNLNLIEKYLKKLLSIKFKYKTKIFITSQTYPGYTDLIKKKYLKKNKKIDLIYMVDTLKMGEAVERFKYPQQLVFGAEKKNIKFILKLFQKFRCKKFFFSYKEAELIKVSINLYLYFSVNFANTMQNISEQIGINFSRIINSLKIDPRIGYNSYIHPSLGISGGHLERDAFYVKEISRDKYIKNIIYNFQKFNNNTKDKLKSKIVYLSKKKITKILIIGLSYKKNSFSVIGSIFNSILKDKSYLTEVYNSFFPNINMKIKQVQNLKKSIAKSDVIIFNYANLKDLRIIKKEFKKNQNKILINISSEYKEFVKNKNNVYNFFLKEQIEHNE